MSVTQLENTVAGSPRLRSLLSQIDAREARVGVVGLGYVGLPLALLFESRGFPVIGFDTDPEKPRMLSAGQRSEEHTSELQSRLHLVCRLVLENENNAAGTAASQ